MISDPQPLPLDLAQSLAAVLCAKFAPHCARLEIAGSIRRERPTVGDIDLVVIPKLDHARDMLGTIISTKNHLLEYLRKSVEASADHLEWITGGHDADGKNHSLTMRTKSGRIAQVDIFCCTVETWGTTLLCRTGSAQHNIWLAQRAQAAGGKWSSLLGLRLDDFSVIADTEENIYAALCLPFIEPHNRELPFLEKL